MDKEEFITRRTQIISEMLDNQDETTGICPTSKCFEQLDKLFDKLQSAQSEAMEKNAINCSTCKHWGGQGLIGIKKTTRGEYRLCIAYLFGDIDNRDFRLMPDWTVTFGSLNGAKGVLKVHENYRCINHNSTFDVK